MVNIPLGKSDWRRSLAQSPYIRMRNRYFEGNPTNQVEQQSLLARPALQRWINVGVGPNRGLYSQPGSFNDALFVMSADELYMVGTDGSSTLLGDGFFDDMTTRASMAATAAIGSTPEYLYIADGTALRCYAPATFATGELLVPTAIANNDRVVLGGVYYDFKSGSVDAGAPAGTLANPWLVKHGTTARESIENLRAAVNATGVAGTTYSTALIANASATITAVTETTAIATARVTGAAGNAITTTTTITGASWTGATLSGGDGAGLSIVDLPDGLLAISVGFIAGYIIIVPKPAQGFKGRFFWIEPGETTVQPLNFATAERSPDPAVSVRVVGDQFAIFGTSSTEFWYPTGELLTPFARSQSRVFERGIWEGSDVQIKDTLILMDTDGVVYRLDGNGPVPISDNSVVERTRAAIKLSVTQTGPAPGPGPGPLSATLAAPGQTTSAGATQFSFTPVLAQASGGVGPYAYRFYWSNRVNGTFGFAGNSTQALVTPQVSAVANSTVATATLLCEVTDAQGTRATTTGASYQFSNTLAIDETPPPTGPTFNVALTYTSDFSSGINRAGATFAANTATPSAGTGPFTYAWYIESLSGGVCTITTPSAATTTFQIQEVGPGEAGVASIRCRVTDSLGAFGISPALSLSVFNILPPGSFIP